MRAGQGIGRGGGSGGMGRGATQGICGTVNRDAAGVPPQQPPGTTPSPQSELEMLKGQAEMMAQQLKEVMNLIEQLGSSKRPS